MEDNQDLSRIPIGRFSQMTRLTPKALRIYDKKELIIPDKDPYTGYRYYNINQIELGIKIKMLVTLGFSLEDVREIIDATYEDNRELLKQKFSNRLSHIQIEIGRLKKIEEILIAKKPMELLFMKCSEPVIKKFPKTRVISKRDKGVYGIKIPQLIGELMSQIYNSDNRDNVNIVGPLMFIAHDTEFKENDADIEIAVPISGRITLNQEEIEIKIIPGGDVVSVIYTGPYSDVGIGYTRAITYINENNLKIAGQIREIYLNDPQKVAEDQLLTEIQIPIEREQ